MSTIQTIHPEDTAAFMRLAGDVGLSPAVIERLIMEDCKGAFLLWADEKGLQGEDWRRLIITLQFLKFTPLPAFQEAAEGA